MKLAKIKIFGHSMWPNLKNHDEQYVLLMNDITCGVGDIAVFLDENSKEMTAHRVVSLDGRTKGDRSYYIDLKSEKKIGMVVGFKRDKLGTIIWGEKGQPFKVFLSYLSRRSLKETKMRFIFLALIYLTSIASFLISLMTTKYHKKRLLIDYPLTDA